LMYSSQNFGLENGSYHGKLIGDILVDPYEMYKPNKKSWTLADSFSS